MTIGIDNSEYINQVVRGGQLLDEKLPDWYHRIDIDDLRMSSLNYCILGQLYEDYAHGLSILGIRANQTHHYGFDVVSHDYRNDYFELTETWKDYILARRAK